MNNSIGGIYALALVFFGIVIISGFMAFTTNYNKAFKMKNRIVYILEKYDNNPTSSDALEEIRDYAKSIGYSASSQFTSSCNGTSYTLDGNNTGWCYQVIYNSKKDEATNGSIDEYDSKYVNVRTFVSIDIPILNTLFPHIKYFSVDGSTKQIVKLNR